MKRATFVCLTSRLCNLRCSYCDELPLLSDSRRISLDQIEHVFRHIADYYGSSEPVRIVFQWYGGEPLLIEPAFYRKVFDQQRKVFTGSPHTITNTVQTNLNVALTADLIELLRDEFDAIGVSLDIVGGLRIDARGRDHEQKAVARLEQLISLGFLPKLGGITVLSGRNQGAMKTIFEFYKLRGLSFRLLPLENGLYGSSSAFGLTARDILRALCELADLWFEDPCIEIEPLKRCLKMMGYAAANPDNRALLYDLNRWNAVQMIDVDGELYTYPDRFKTERSMGNLFNTSLTNIFASASHAAAAARANRRMDSACLTCPYLGRSCDGSPMADGEMGFGEYREDGSEVCVVTKGLLKHLETRLQQANLLSTGAVRREMS